MQQLNLFFISFCLVTIAHASTGTTLDSIVAIVDEGVITQRQLENQIQLIKREFKRSNRNTPNSETLERQVLESLILNSLLLQEAARRGIKVTDSQLNQTMQNIAKQNNMNLSDYRISLIGEGLNYDKYRETVRHELILSNLQRQYGQRNATISDAEVDDFIARSDEEDASYEYRIAHILLSIPDAASPEQVSEAQTTADEILQQLNAGEGFENLANTFSSSANALQGGDLGWRKKAEIPSLFTEEVLKMKPGEYAGPLRSASGLHIIYLKERKILGQVLTEQTKSRHILIKPNELISEEESRKRLEDLRNRVLSGEDFDRLARLYSVDYVSGALGGDIGWQQPGSTVKQFEIVANQLDIGEVSEPFRTRFGWHILEVTDRRTVDETAQNKRDKIHGQLLRQKQSEVFDLWKQRLRDKAYIIYPEKPDA